MRVIDYEMDGQDRIEPNWLPGLSGLPAKPSGIWGPAALRALLQRHLNSTLTTELCLLDPRMASAAAKMNQPEGLFKARLEEVLHRDYPPVGVLRLIKAAAETNLRDDSSLYPAEIPCVIFYAAIAAGLSRCAANISRLTLAEISIGLSWAARESWVDDSTRKLLQEGLQVVAPNELMAPA